jgi:hypothetical protein
MAGRGWAGGAGGWPSGAPAEKLGRLLQLVRNDATVRACLARVGSYVVPRHVALRERGPEGEDGFHALAEELDAFLGAHFARFLAGALESLFACGFVVFVVRRRELRGKVLSVPVLLPLGGFTWTVQAVESGRGGGAGVKRKRRLGCGEEDALYYYDVNPTHPEVRAEQLFVWSARAAAPGPEAMASPLDGVLAEWDAVREFEALARRTDEWNSTKHVTTSEKVDAPRDQTTDGISLLDDFRRYIMSGQHTGISSNYMMMSGPEGPMAREDPSNAANSWIEDFAFAGAKGQATCVHVMPPNTTVGELGALELKHDREEVLARFERRVLGVFELTSMRELSGQNTAALASENEVRGMRRLVVQCEAMLEHVYAATFEVDAADVRVTLPRPMVPAALGAAGAGGAAKPAKKAEAAKPAKKAEAAKPAK